MSNIWLAVVFSITGLMSTLTLANDVPDEIYTGCGTCHEVDNAPTINFVPLLANQSSSYILKQVRAFKTGKRTFFRKDTPERAFLLKNTLFANLSESQLEKIARYYEELPALTREKSWRAPEDQSELGKILFEKGDLARQIQACVDCHGSNGESDVAAGVPRLNGQNSAYTANQLQMYKTGSRMSDDEAVMRTIAKSLTAEEIGNLSSYLYNLGVN